MNSIINILSAIMTMKIPLTINIIILTKLKLLMNFSTKYLISKTKVNFDVIAISESRNLKNRSAINDNLKNSSYAFS